MKPLILISNDDGINSPGLKAAVEAVFKLGDIIVAAPHEQQTGMGRAFPRTEDLGTIEEVLIQIGDNEISGYAVHGSPAYAVAHGVLELSDRKPDLCISGINYGENLGMIPTCSGTVGACFEAVSHGIPAIAFSIQIDFENQRKNTFEEIDWTEAKLIVRYWAEKFFREGMPKGVDLLNINLPFAMEDADAYRITKMSNQNYYEFIRPPKRDFSKPFLLQSELKVHMDQLEKDSDIYAVYVDHITAVTPMSCDMSVNIGQY